MLPEVRVRYRLVGRAGAPVVLALGGISADRCVSSRPGGTPGWWGALFGPGKAVPTERFRVLSFDFLGGNGATTGPRTLPPGMAADEPCTTGSGGAPSAFPEVSTFDQARVLLVLLDRLGIARLHAIVGASYGGMVGLAAATLRPDVTDRLFVISAAHESAPLATAWRVIQRRIVQLAASAGRTSDGLALARALAMTTYRTPDELAARFPGPRRADADPDAFPVWDYLAARGEDYVQKVHPEAFVTLSRSIDLHSIEPEKIVTPLTLVSVRQDQCVPPSLTEALARRVAGPCELVTLDSIYGHDAFLKEDGIFTQLLQRI